jgi:hypothetical protein
MDSLMEKMIEYYKKEGIDYPKTKNGEPNMIYKQNRDTYNKMREECVICSEKMKGIAELECGHKMCIQCCIKHFRKKETCPFCRKIICSKDKPMEIQEYQTTVDNVLDASYSSRHNLSMFHYMIEKIGSNDPIDCVAFDILHEIKLTCLDAIILSHE